MNKKFAGIALSAILVCAMASPVFAQETPSSTWGDSETWKTPNERVVDLATAEAIERMRNDGYGPGDTHIAGDYNSYTTNHGPVSNSSATNAINYTENSSRVDANGGSTATITYSTGATSYQASQNANAQTASSENGDNNLDSHNTQSTSQ